MENLENLLSNMINGVTSIKESLEYHQLIAIMILIFAKKKKSQNTQQ